MSALSFLFNIVVEVLARAKRQENEIKEMKIRRDNMIIMIGSSKEEILFK